MGTTATLHLPYPESTDPANVPADMQELADKLDTNNRVCVLKRTTTLSFPTGSGAPILTFPTVVHDPHSMYVATGIHAGQVTLPIPGIWQAIGSCQWEANAVGIRSLDFITSDAAFSNSQSNVTAQANAASAGSGNDVFLNLTAVFKTTTPNEHVMLYPWQVSSGNLLLVEAYLAVSCLQPLT